MDIIIGAGISGLSYAAFCGHTDYLILEQSDRIGGYCKTTERDGFVWDYSGHFFHFKDPQMERFVTAEIPQADLLHVTKRTQIRYKDRLIDYPFQKNIHQLPKEEFEQCLYDLFHNPVQEYDNFRQMLYAKFGRSIADKFLIPYNSKLYACDLNTLDKDAMGRFFPYAEKEEIVRNAQHQDNSAYNTQFVYPKHGAIQYIRSVAQRIDASKIRLNTRVTAIDAEHHTVRLQSGESVHYDRLISTIPFPLLLQQCGADYDTQAYSWNQVLVFNLGFDSPGLERVNHWIYFPEPAYCFYRVGFYNNILGADRLSLYVELGFSKDAQVRPEEWYPRVLADLVQAKIITPDMQPVASESIIMNPAYVHITNASIRDVEEQKNRLAQNQIYSIGRYGSWTYCSIEDNMQEAKALAEELNR